MIKNTVYFKFGNDLFCANLFLYIFFENCSFHENFLFVLHLVLKFQEDSMDAFFGAIIPIIEYFTIQSGNAYVYSSASKIKMRCIPRGCPIQLFVEAPFEVTVFDIFLPAVNFARNAFTSCWCAFIMLNKTTLMMFERKQN